MHGTVRSFGEFFKSSFSCPHASFFLICQVYLDSENAIRSSECECPRGKFRCSHAAALFIHGIYNFSRRDVECSWKKRKANTPLSWQPFEEMFPPTKQYSSLLRNPTQSDRSGPYRDLQEYGRFTGLCWLMSPEPLELPIPTIEDIIYSEEFLRIQGSQQQIDCLVRQASIPDEHILKISEIKIGQRNNPNLAFSQEGQINSKQLWLCFEGQMGDSISLEAPSWRI